MKEYKVVTYVYANASNPLVTVGASNPQVSSAYWTTSVPSDHTEYNSYGWTFRTEYRVVDTRGSDSSGGYVPPTPKNKVPTVSGKDEDLGGKTKAFSYEYVVNDEDNDEVRVDISVNEDVVESITNAPRNKTLTFSISQETFGKLPIGEESHIVIKVTDKKGAYALRNLTFRRVNAPPKITVETSIENVQDVDATFTVRYVATDEEGDPLKGRVLIDGVGGELKPIQNGVQESFELPHLQFIQLAPGDHVISVEVIDGRGQKAVKQVAFKRTAREIVLWLDPAFPTSTLAEKITAAYTLIKGGTRASVKVEACNNAMDDSPAWEDITEAVENKRLHTFINKEHGESQGVSLRFTVKANGEQKETVLKGFSGRIE